MDETHEERWLTWAKELQFLAQAGLTYTKDPFDAERFQCIRELIDLLSDGRSLMGQHICHLFRRIERDQAVSDIIQRKSKGF